MRAVLLALVVLCTLVLSVRAGPMAASAMRQRIEALRADPANRHTVGQVPRPVHSGAAGDAPCTSYARQDNCVGNPALRPDAMPACGAFAGPLPPNTTAFAIIGDYGLEGQCASQVAALTLKLQQQFGQLEFVMTLGDNAYWTGTCESLNTGVGQYYSSFLPDGVNPPCTDPTSARRRARGYTNPHEADMRAFLAHQKMVQEQHELTRTKSVEEGADRPSGIVTEAQRQATTAALLKDAEARRLALVSNVTGSAPVRFYPSLGNHDFQTYGANPHTMPYFQYFGYLASLEPASLASGQFYRVLTPVPGVELYALNSNLGNPSGSPSDQALHALQVKWLQAAVSNSTAEFKIVYFHHPPWSTAQHDALSPWMDLPYEDWGVTAVFCGHQHVYERMLITRPGSKTSLPYVINGLGGHPWTYTITGCPAWPGSIVRYNTFHGMQLAIRSYDEKAAAEKIDFCFYSLEDGGILVDQFELVGASAQKKQ